MRYAPTTNEASERSAETRHARARIRADLRAGNLTLDQLLADPPQCIHGRMLFEILMWQPRFGKDRLRRINNKALRDNVNLMLAVDVASQRTLEWVAANGSPYLS